MTDGTGTTTWDLNAFGEPIGITRGSGAKIGYEYDKTGHPTGITYPGGAAQKVVQTFDKAGRLATVTDWNANRTGFGYGPDGDLQTTTYPNGTVVTNGFDDSGTLTSSTLKAGTATLASLTYGRDAAHKLSGSTPSGLPGAAQTYGYSPRGQLASATTGAATTQYKVDAADNPVGLGTATQAFDPANQLCWTLPSGTVANPDCAAPPSGATKYEFDSQGNRKKATPATGAATAYGYDQANRLTSVTGPSNATYRYDGDGLRTGKTVGTSSTTFTWGAGPVPNLLSDGTSSYVYGPNGAPIAQLGSGSTLWFFHDQIGSTRALTDNAGKIAGTYSYAEYGASTHGGTAATPLQYAGQYTDAETGFVYLRARFYDPATAQFLTVDPQFEQTDSRYAYAEGDPLNKVDPDGKWAFLAALLAPAAAISLLATAVAVVIVVVVVIAIIDKAVDYYAASSNRSNAHQPVPPPTSLPGLGNPARVSPKNGRARWEDKKKIYEWDSKKGEVECYRKSDEEHLGGFDPNTGDQTSKPVKNRRPGR
jgi:RHS repeat-associated protein